MRCMACGDNMRLVRVELDRALPVTGYERHTYKCAACQDTEQRLVFNRPAKAEPFQEAPPLAVEHEVDAKEGEALLRHAAEMVTGPARVTARSARMRTVAELRGKPCAER
jgi:hypothetical protein